MRVAVAGGGPGGLFFATLLRRFDPSIKVTVFERDRADDTFGFGVVFSDRTLEGIHEADPVLRQALDAGGCHWDDIEVRLKGERIRCGGNGMAAIVRTTLLHLLQERAVALGADLRFSTEVTLDDLGDYDLVVAADGTGSRIREQVADYLEVTVETSEVKFIWFGTDYLFDGLTFVHEHGPHGAFAVHGYPISDSVSTFIVEADEATWRRAGLDEFDVTQTPGPSDMRTKEYLQGLFANQIDGRELLVNNSRWSNFVTRRTRPWHVFAPQPVAFLGDAVHTAHFSVGSGTKMAMEDAVALASAVAEHKDDMEAAFGEYERTARPPVERVQDAARPSLSWWERFSIYHDAFEPWQFAYHFLTRSISDSRLERRDPSFVTSSHKAWHDSFGYSPLGTPIKHGGWSTPGRVATVVEKAGVPVSLTADGTPLPLLTEGVDSGQWGGLVEAPEDEAGLTAARAELASLANRIPNCLAVYGGVSLTRVLLTEEARFHYGLPSVLVDQELDRDKAVTAVLAGRTDLVGVTPEVAAEWDVTS